MLEDIKNNKIDTIDLSRFGKFLEITFFTINVRLISIIDKIDGFKNSELSSSMLVNFKNLINDEYAKDIFRNIKSVYTIKQNRGTMSLVVYYFVINEVKIINIS